MGGRLKDFVSGMVRLVEAKVRPFAERPKREDRVEIGAMLTDMIQNCIAEYGLEEEIKFGEHQPVDFVWLYLSFGWECKRFIDTEFRNSGHAIAWLKSEVYDRFREQEIILGKPIRYRGLVLNEKRWDEEVDCWLAGRGFHVLEVGKVDSPLERAKASMVFMAWFEDMVWKICDGQVMMVG